MPANISIANAKIKALTPKGQKPTYRRTFVSTGRKIAIRAMLANGMSQWQIAAIEQLSRSTVNAIAHDKELDNLQPQAVEQTRKLLAGRFYVMADKAVDKAQEDNRLEKMNSYQLAMIGAVSVDKARLMEGLSTENLAVRGVNEQTLKAVSEMNDLKRFIYRKAEILSGDRVPVKTEEDK